MIVSIKFKLDYTQDEYKDINDKLLLEDMMDRITSNNEGIELIETKK